MLFLDLLTLVIVAYHTAVCMHHRQAKMLNMTTMTTFARPIQELGYTMS